MKFVAAVYVFGILAQTVAVAPVLPELSGLVGQMPEPEPQTVFGLIQRLLVQWGMAGAVVVVVYFFLSFVKWNMIQTAKQSESTVNTLIDVSKQLQASTDTLKALMKNCDRNMEEVRRNK